MDHFKNLYWICYNIPSVFLCFGGFFGHEPCGILVHWPGIEPVPPAVEAQSLNHWTTREVLERGLLSPSPNMMGLWPLPWLASAHICLCVCTWGTGRDKCSLRRKELHFTKRLQEPRDHLAYPPRFTDEQTEAVRPSASCQLTQPATEPGPEHRGPASLASSGFQNHPWVGQIC